MIITGKDKEKEWKSLTWPQVCALLIIILCCIKRPCDTKIRRSSHLTPFVQSSFIRQRNLSGSVFMDNKGLSLTSTPICVSQIVTQPLVSPVGGKKQKITIETKASKNKARERYRHDYFICIIIWARPPGILVKPQLNIRRCGAV